MDRSVWTILFTLNVVLLVLLGLSFPFVERGTPTFVITLLSLAIIGISLLGLSLLIYFD